jgi:hypothetical protein
MQIAFLCECGQIIDEIFAWEHIKACPKRKVDAKGIGYVFAQRVNISTEQNAN